MLNPCRVGWQWLWPLGRMLSGPVTAWPWGDGSWSHQCSLQQNQGLFLLLQLQLQPHHRCASLRPWALL